MLDRSEMPDDAILSWVEGKLGPVEVLSRFAHGHGYSQLWRLASRNGNVWLKMHAHPHKWAGEVHALTVWTPTLGQTPSVLAYREGPEAVLLTEAEGRNAEEVERSDAQDEQMWREAGAWLAQLHATENDWLGNVQADGRPKDEPVTDAEAFVRGNWEASLAKGKASGLFSQAEIDFAAGSVAEKLPSLRGERACAIHRDYTPRNWMCDSEGRLAAIIDFEHARWDVRAADLQRPWDHEFLRNPRLADAFYEGYGGLGPKLRVQIETLRTMNALTTVVWATNVGDAPFAQRGRDALSRLMSDR